MTSLGREAARGELKALAARAAVVRKEPAQR